MSTGLQEEKKHRYLKFGYNISYTIILKQNLSLIVSQIINEIMFINSMSERNDEYVNHSSLNTVLNTENIWVYRKWAYCDDVIE